MRKTNDRLYSSADMDLIAALYARYKGIMFKTAMDNLQNKSDLDDVVQDTILRMVQNLETIRPLDEKACAVYIARTVYTAALDYDRRTARERVRSVGLDDVLELSTGQDPEQALIERETLARRLKALREALEELSETDRELLIGKYIRGESDESLAKRLHLGAGTIRVRLMRARQRARRIIEKKVSADEHK